MSIIIIFISVDWMDWGTLSLSLALVFLAKPFLLILWQILKQFMPNNWVSRYGLDRGKWAVVTGATDGVGLGFVEALVEKGCNVVLISRNEEKIKRRIDEITKDLEKRGKKVPQMKFIVADFKDSSSSVFIKGILEQLKGLEISMLVNNVGTSQTLSIQDYSHQLIVEMINVNCVSMVALTSVLAPLMSRRAAIVNLSSYMGEITVPYVCLYSATKAFNALFSEGVSLEAELKGIDILSVKPWFVESPLSRAKKGFFVPDRVQCARACLMELKWQYETSGYFLHRVLSVLARLVPMWMVRIVARSPIADKMMEREVKEKSPKGL